MDDQEGSLLLSIESLYLDTAYMGGYFGTITGNYGPYDSYWFEGLGSGAYEEQPLTFNGYWGYDGGREDINCLFYNDDGDMMHGGDEYGLIGSVIPNWGDAQSFSILAMGLYYDEEGADKYIWSSNVYSFNEDAEDSTTRDGGAFYGYTAGLWSEGAMEGALAALYIDPDGKAGYLTGNIFGSYNSDINMWMAEGLLTPTEMAQGSEFSPEDLSYYITRYGQEELNADASGDFGSDSDDYISGSSYSGGTYFINDEDNNSQAWGIYDLKLGDGNSYYNPNGSKLWMATIEGEGQFGYRNSQGILKGDVFGIYDGPYDGGYGSWVATSVGTWRKYTLGEGSSTQSGAYYGFIGGLWDDNMIIGKMVAIYAQPSGAKFGEGVPFSGSSVEGFGDFGNMEVTDVDGIDPNIEDINSNWGIWKFNVNGTFETSLTSPFKLTIGGSSDEGHWVGILAGSQKSESDILIGAFRGMRLDVEEGHACLYIGDTLGIVENNIWEGVGLGEWESFTQPGDIDMNPTDFNDFITNYVSSEPIICQGAGNFDGTGSIDPFVATGADLNLEHGDNGLSRGLYYLTLGGTYNNPLARPIWSSVLGEDDPSSDEYFIIHTSGTWRENNINGIARGTVLTDGHLGEIEGSIFGLYDEPSIGVGTWDAVTVGLWREEPLTLSGVWGEEEASLYYNNNGNFKGALAGEEYGLIGAVTENWGSQESFTIVAMGEYDAKPGLYIWNTPIHSSHGLADDNTTRDGGAFYGFTSGIWNNGKMDGSAVAVYASPTGITDRYDIGFLRGALAGDYYPGISMWEGRGTLRPTLMEYGVSLTSEDLNQGPDMDEITDIELYGSFNGEGAIYGALNSGFSYNAVDKEDEPEWGVYDIKFGKGNTFSNPDPETNTSWSAVMGQIDENGYGSSYMFSKISGSWENGEIRAIVDGTILSDSRLGTIEGDFFGINSAQQGTWIGSTVGVWYEEMLSSSGYTSLWLVQDGVETGIYTEGLIGLTGDIWGDDATPHFTSIGLIDADEEPDFDKNRPFLWMSDQNFQSYNWDNESDTTYGDDGEVGAFYGIGGGIGNVNSDAIGKTVLLYISPAGETGILRGGLEGMFSGDIRMYMLSGDLTNTIMGTTEIDPEDLIDNIFESTMDGSGAGDFNGNGIIELAESDGFGDSPLDGVTMAIANNDDEQWGIWGIFMNGTYENPLNSSSWTLALGVTSITYFDEVPSSDAGVWLGTLNGTECANGELAGDWRGFYFSPPDEAGNITAGTSSGDFIGTYIEVEENVGTWQAVGAGEWVEVTDLLSEEMLGFDMAQLQDIVSVPITEVYSNLLTGSGGFITAASMDLSIYQSALGQLWAALLSGNYSGDTSNTWNLTLNNGSDSVLLNGSQWSDGQWLADVTGTVNGTDISGGAGGTYADGTFIGVGAGTVDQPE